MYFISRKNRKKFVDNYNFGCDNNNVIYSRAYNFGIPSPDFYNRGIMHKSFGYDKLSEQDTATSDSSEDR